MGCGGELIGDCGSIDLKVQPHHEEEKLSAVSNPMSRCMYRLSAASG